MRGILAEGWRFIQTALTGRCPERTMFIILFRPYPGTMRSIFPPALRRLLGGETRARVLGLLADATGPKTGYELAKEAHANPSKVYGILRDLTEAGLVNVVSDRPGIRHYSLADADLRRFLLRYVRITTLQ